MQALFLAVLAAASAKAAPPLDAASAEQRMAVFARRCVDLRPARVASALRDEFRRQQQGMASP